MEKLKLCWKNYRLFVCLGSILLLIFCGVAFIYFQRTFTAETSWDLAEESQESSVSSETRTTEKTEILIDIKGEVKKPGVYSLEPNARIHEAVLLAGGLTEAADEKALNLAAILVDQQMIYVPNKEETEVIMHPQIQEVSAADSTQININTATISQLQELSGIGEKKAQAIIDYREENGPFASVEDLTEVSGIGEKTVEKLKPSITI